MNPEQYQELVKQINNLQKQIDALVNPEVGRWITWTPTITQNVAVAATVTLARYIVQNDAVRAIVILSVTGAGTANNIIHIAGIPSTIAPVVGAMLGNTMIFDSGTAVYAGVVQANGVNDLIMHAHNSVSAMGVVPNFGLANGDIIWLNLSWER